MFNLPEQIQTLPLNIKFIKLWTGMLQFSMLIRWEWKLPCMNSNLKKKPFFFFKESCFLMNIKIEIFKLGKSMWIRPLFWRKWYYITWRTLKTHHHIFSLFLQTVYAIEKLLAGLNVRPRTGLNQSIIWLHYHATLLMTSHGYIQHPAPFCTVKWSFLIIFMYKLWHVWYHITKRANLLFLIKGNW